MIFRPNQWILLIGGTGVRDFDSLGITWRAKTTVCTDKKSSNNLNTEMNSAFLLDKLGMIEEWLVLECQTLILWQDTLDLSWFRCFKWIFFNRKITLSWVMYITFLQQDTEVWVWSGQQIICPVYLSFQNATESRLLLKRETRILLLERDSDTEIKSFWKLATAHNRFLGTPACVHNAVCTLNIFYLKHLEKFITFSSYIKE